MLKKIILLISISAPFITYFFYRKVIKINKKKYPIKLLTLISGILIIISLGSLRYFDNFSPDLTTPNISLKPFDVISIQLNSLQRNNIPFKDAGIEQVWKFAHPNNKKVTGPLEKFKKMIYSENYQMLIEHESSEITILSESENISVFKVYILSSNKKNILTFGKLKKCKQKVI